VKLRTSRRIVQISSLALFVIIPLLNKAEISFVSGTLYSMAIGPVWITDPLIGMQTILTSLRFDGTLLLSMAVPVSIALIAGRVFCSWICPQNTLSEWVDQAAIRIGIKRLFPSTAVPRVRTVVTALVLLAAPLAGFPLASLLSAPGIITAQTAQLIKEGVVGAEVVLIAVILLSEFFLARRVWCNTLCPVGGFLALFRIPRTLRVAFAEDETRVCGRCRSCVDACGLGLDPLTGKIHPLCHNCGDCIASCEDLKGEKKPLQFRW